MLQGLLRVLVNEKQECQKQEYNRVKENVKNCSEYICARSRALGCQLEFYNLGER
jgi:hypothetical protein